MKVKRKTSRFPAATEGMCPSCGAGISSLRFRDEQSRREFRSSGICQECQDEIFYSPYPRQ